MWNEWKAVVFDLDDTLYPERQYVRSGMTAVAAWAEQHLGIARAVAADELWQSFERGIRGNTFDVWLASHGLESSRWTATIVDVYRSHWPRITPHAEVPAVLDRLRSSKRLGLITDGPRAVQERKVMALGLRPFFDLMIFSDTWGREAWKPCPRAFTTVLNEWSLSGEESVYVADNPAKDFRGPRCVGMASIRVRRADGLYCRLEPASQADAPDQEVSDLNELERLIEA